MKKYVYSIYKPGGNDTALVDGLVYDSLLKKKINDSIMLKESNVEQVGFVDFSQRTIKLEMAGGEFCANATRCAAFKFLDGRFGEALINVSGVNKYLKVGVDNQDNVWAEMPIYSDPSRIYKIDNYNVVEMEGITHVIVEKNNIFTNKEQAKKDTKSVLKQLNLFTRYKATGIMFRRKSNKNTFIDPVVWVRDVQTFIYETACGSGTAAIGMLEALIRKSSIELSIIQPSGMPITAQIEIKDNKFISALINGPVIKILEDEILIL